MSDVVERAKSALEGVTRGLWRVGKRKWIGVVLTPYGCVWNPNRGEVNNPPDGEFIAQARTLVPELVAEVERLSQSLNEIRQIVAEDDARGAMPGFITLGKIRDALEADR
ncbi:hypothetical protein [Mycolicibacterium setense]